MPPRPASDARNRGRLARPRRYEIAAALSRMDVIRFSRSPQREATQPIKDDRRMPLRASRKIRPESDETGSAS